MKICLYLNFRNLWNVKFEAKYPSSLSRFQFLQNEKSQTDPKKKQMSNLCSSRLQVSPPYFLPGRAGPYVSLVIFFLFPYSLSASLLTPATSTMSRLSLVPPHKDRSQTWGRGRHAADRHVRRSVASGTMDRRMDGSGWLTAAMRATSCGRELERRLHRSGRVALACGRGGARMRRAG